MSKFSRNFYQNTKKTETEKDRENIHEVLGKCYFKVDKFWYDRNFYK